MCGIYFAYAEHKKGLLGGKMIKAMRYTKLGHNEDGLVSIVVTLLVMSLVTLIAVGFANLATREQRQALDQQLNSQAFYTAESGINEAIKNPGDFNNSTCTERQIADDASVKASCILVNERPLVLEYSDVPTNGSIVVPITPTSDFDSITISWQNKEDAQTFATNSNHYLLSKKDWTTWASPPPLINPRTGILRVALMPGAFADRADLTTKTHSLFLYPREQNPSDATNDGLPTDYTTPIAGSAYTEKGAFVDGNCSASNNDTDTPKFCNVKLNFGATVLGGTTYYLRLRSIYKPLSVSISALEAGNRVTLEGGQIVVDSTGKTTDVLRRLRVNVPASGNIFANRIFPEYAIETTDTLCKRLRVGPGFDANTDVTSGIDSTVCSPNPSTVSP